MRPGEKFNGFTASDVWWLSFVGDEGFRGIAIVRGVGDIDEAIKAAWVAGCNPGGEVQGMPLPKERLHWLRDDEFERLLTRKEAEAINDRAQRNLKQRGEA